jgi:hypothetical protein
MPPVVSCLLKNLVPKAVNHMEAYVGGKCLPPT